jgi:hypothetical protein
MARRRSRLRRSATEWVVRGIVAATTAVVGIMAIGGTLATTYRSRDVTRAHALAPSNGRITAAYSQRFVGLESNRLDLDRARRLGLRALRQDPTAVPAVVTLGIVAQAQGDKPAAARLFAFSEKLSRRDFQTQLWLIEDAVSRGNVAGALTHYDTALRTSRIAPDVLFPILSGAAADPTIRDGLLRVFLKRPSWMESFIAYMARNGPSPQATASLLLRARSAGVPVSAEAGVVLITSLIARGQVEDAWRFYAASREKVDRRISRDPRFNAVNTAPSLFDWVLTEDAGMGASMQREGDAGLFDFAVPPGMGGPLIQQMQVLPPGEYQLTGHSRGVDQPSASSPYWVVSCRDGGEVARVPIPNSTERNGYFAGVFRIPSDCPVQTLVFMARPSEALSGSTGQLDQVQVRPAG